MVNIDEWTITNAVLKAGEACPDLRLRQVLASLVIHLHQFARDIQLTEAEWAAGIQFLTDAGHITNDKRQEFILLSDTLGLSTLVTAQNNAKPGGCTEATVFGPFFVPDAPSYRNGDDIANGATGEPCFVSCVVRGRDAPARPSFAARRSRLKQLTEI
jgi:hydroxyquinol 1,2-dioxygenase